MPDHPQHFYQAIAIIQGQLLLDGPHSILTIGDWDYPAYASKVVRRKHRPGRVQNFRVYPCIRHKQLAFQLVNVVDSPPTPITLNGCWELHKDKPYFIIYRNGVLPLGDRFYRNLVPVHWENVPPADGQFWQAIAEVRDGAIVITYAEGPYDPPPKATRFVLSATAIAPHLESASAEAAPTPVSAKPPTVQEIRAMATAAKISLTCKLNQVPAHRELVDKRIEFYLKDGESDRIFTVQMKAKVFKKLIDHGFADWVAAITGEIGPATETGFELVNAAVQVFEKKAKAEADAVTEVKPTAVVQHEKSAGDAVGKAVVEQKGDCGADKGDAGVKAGVGQKKKGLLDGVRLK